MIIRTEQTMKHRKSAQKPKKRKIWKTLIGAFMLAGLLSTAFAQDYYGGELFTIEPMKYGKFEARMRMVAGSGIVSSMFTYYNDSYLGSPEPWREVDIEVLGKNPLSFQSNVITGSASSRITSEDHHDVPGGADASYHTYGLEWTPDYLAWFLDGVEVRRDSGQQVTDLQDKEQNLRFNLWIANIVSWVGAFDPAVLPKHQFINWVQFSEYTPGAGTDGSDFTLAWRDDFDSFDSNRWGKGNWTFAENMATFLPENIGVKEGTLVIALTTADAFGIDVEVPADDGSTSAIPLPKNDRTASVYWSAATRSLSFETAGMKEPIVAELLDVSGRRLAMFSSVNRNGQGESLSWNIGEFAAGVKIVKIYDGKGQSFSSIIADM